MKANQCLTIKGMRAKIIVGDTEECENELNALLNKGVKVHHICQEARPRTIGSGVYTYLFITIIYDLPAQIEEGNLQYP